MIYGVTPYHVEDDQTDRIGIRTLVMSKLWQASRWPMSQEELDEEQPPPPPVAGGVLFIGSQTRRQGGALRTYWTFEGVAGNGKSVTFKGRGNSLDYRFEPGFSQRNILEHPQITTLLKKFGGAPVGNRVVWQPTVPKDTQQTGLSGATKTEKDQQNPMLGRDTFLSFEGTYIFRYAAFAPPTVPSGVKIRNGGLPGNPPIIGTARNWLELPATWQQRGPVCDIEEMYLLSAEGGWQSDIYDILKSASNNGGTNTSLTTGGLTTGSLS